MTNLLKRWGGLAAMLGGALWVLYYALFVAFSAPSGRSLNMGALGLTPTVQILVLAYLGAILLIGVGLLGLRARLRGRAPIWGAVGGILAVGAIVLALAGLARLTGLFGTGNPLGNLGGFAVLCTSLGGVTMGLATALASTLPGRSRFLPLAVGLLTFPVIIGVGTLSAVLADYLVDEFPFAFLGLGWLAIGITLHLANDDERAGATGDTAARPPAAQGLGTR